jgi:hypothetical protein
MRIILTASLLATSSSLAFAQSFEGPPAYGDISWSPGQEAASIAILAAGAMPADWLSSGCSGYISPAPSARLVLEAGGDVAIAAGSDEDLTLVVRGPDGTISCNDDGADSFNPGLTLTDAAPGAYEIWVGTYSAGVGHPATVIHVADEFITANPFVVTPDPMLAAAQSVRLRAGFDDDPRRVAVRAGGEAALDGLGDSCFGYASAEPDVAVNYSAGDYDLYFMMTSEADGVMAVRTPSGEYLCNDDQVGLDPGVQIEDPETGEYLIWAGLLGDNRRVVDGEVTISEIGYAGFDNRLDLSAEARFDTIDLVSGFTPDPVTITGSAGGRVDANVATADGVTASGYCTGYVSREPSIELTYEAGALPLYIAARSQGDLTLVINAPDGSWHCDDDSGGDLNPEVSFDSPQSGVYDIYVGTFDEQDFGSGEAEVFISELEGIPAGPQLDLSLMALFGDVELSAGFTPDPHIVTLEAGGPLNADEAGAGAGWNYCPGYTTQAPSVQLTWDGEGDPLSFYLDADRDTTLAINLPDGSWVCDDDGGEGLNAAITLDTAASGVYDIYVGLFSDGETAPARLNISELGAPADDWSDMEMDG